MAGDPSEDRDDELLAVRMSCGDEDALRAVLRLHGGKVRGWLRSKYGSVLQDGELAEAFNGAVIKLWNNAGKFNSSRGSLGGWFLRIAQREALTVIRRELAYRGAHPELNPNADPAGGCPDPEECQTLDRQARKRIEDLHQVVDALPPKQKAIILADLAAGGPADAGRLAAVLETSKNSIYVLRNKAHESIWKAMQQRGHYQDRQGRKP